eukprot:10085-Amphidinium_carterae.2
MGALSQLPQQMQHLQQQFSERLLVTENASKDAVHAAHSAASSAEHAAKAAMDASRLASEALKEAKVAAAAADTTRSSPPRGGEHEESIVVIGSWPEVLRTQKPTRLYWSPYKRSSLCHVKVKTKEQGEELISAVKGSGHSFSTRPVWAAWRAPAHVRAFRARCYRAGQALKDAYMRKHPAAPALELDICTSSGKLWYEKFMVGVVERQKETVTWRNLGVLEVSESDIQL